MSHSAGALSTGPALGNFLALCSITLDLPSAMPHSAKQNRTILTKWSSAMSHSAGQLVSAMSHSAGQLVSAMLA
jgi:hypothetical protein